MNFNKSLIFSLICTSFAMNGLSAIDATSKLFKAISDDSFIAAKEAIAEGANLSAINPATDKSVLYEAINNYYKQAQKSFGLRVAAATTTGLGALSGGLIAWVGGEDLDEQGIRLVLASATLATGLITIAGSLLGSVKYIKSGLHARSKIRNAFSILSLVYKEIIEKNIKPDEESLVLIKKLTPQLEKALKAQK